MNVALRRRTMTEAEFLAWVEPLEQPYEFDGAGPVLRPTGTVAHGLIQANLIVALANRLRKSGFHVLGSCVFVRAGCSLRLPDALVIHREVLNHNRVIADPVVVLEILSESTAHTDRFTKAREYWDTSSVQHYVMLEQHQIGAVVLSRGAETWRRHTVDGKGVIELPSTGISVALGDIYDGLTFPKPPVPEV